MKTTKGKVELVMKLFYSLLPLSYAIIFFWAGPCHAGVAISNVLLGPLSGGNLSITIQGSGFGIAAPFDGNSLFIMVEDLNHPGGAWRAGNAGDWDPTTLIDGDGVTVNVTSWTDTLITVANFSRYYGTFNWYFSSGDSLRIYIQNPQSQSTVVGATYNIVIPAFLSIDIVPDSIPHQPGYRFGLLFDQNEITNLTSVLLSHLQSQGFFDPRNGGATVTVDSASPTADLNLDVSALDFLMGVPDLAGDVASSFEEIGVWGTAASAATDVLSPLPGSVDQIALSITGNILNGVLAVSRQDWVTWLSTATVDGKTVKYVVPPSETMQINVPLSSVPKSDVNINLSGAFDSTPLAIAPASIGQLPIPVTNNAYTEEEYDLHPYCYVMDLWGNPISGVSVTGITHPSNETPKRFSLNQNYPNPFNPTTTISFSLKDNSTVRLSIYNVLGQEVWKFDLGRLDAGTYSEDVDMSRFASGVYFYRIEAVGNNGERSTAMKKMVLIK